MRTLNELLKDTHLDSRDLVALREDPFNNEESMAIDAIVAELNDHAEDNAQDGVFLIRESYWTEYAQELAEDIGAINRDAPWPNNHIDWDRAAQELAMDYTTIEIDGVTWYYR